jgi:short-subunit dehydrogenase
VIFQASKGAVIRFYETLRAELGSHVRVTILMPGYVVSNLTKGKGLQKDGHVGIDEEARDVIKLLSSTSTLYIFSPLMNMYTLKIHAVCRSMSGRCRWARRSPWRRWWWRACGAGTTT